MPNAQCQMHNAQFKSPRSERSLARQMVEFKNG